MHARCVRGAEVLYRDNDLSRSRVKFASHCTFSLHAAAALITLRVTASKLRVCIYIYAPFDAFTDMYIFMLHTRHMIHTPSHTNHPFDRYIHRTN